MLCVKGEQQWKGTQLNTRNTHFSLLAVIAAYSLTCWAASRSLVQRLYQPVCVFVFTSGQSVGRLGEEATGSGQAGAPARRPQQQPLPGGQQRTCCAALQRWHLCPWPAAPAKTWVKLIAMQETGTKAKAEQSAMKCTNKPNALERVSYTRHQSHGI